MSDSAGLCFYYPTLIRSPTTSNQNATGLKQTLLDVKNNPPIESDTHSLFQCPAKSLNSPSQGYVEIGKAKVLVTFRGRRDRLQNDQFSSEVTLRGDFGNSLANSNPSNSKNSNPMSSNINSLDSYPTQLFTVDGNLKKTPKTGSILVSTLDRFLTLKLQQSLEPVLSLSEAADPILLDVMIYECGCHNGDLFCAALMACGLALMEAKISMVGIPLGYSSLDGSYTVGIISKKGGFDKCEENIDINESEICYLDVNHLPGGKVCEKGEKCANLDIREILQKAEVRLKYYESKLREAVINKIEKLNGTVC